MLTPRWLGISLFALLAIPFCVFMGTWQLGRFDARVEAHHTAQREPAAGSRAPVPLRSLLPGTGTPVNQATVGRPVTVSGEYDAGHQLLVPDRQLDGRQGFYVLTPVRTSGGAVAVVRGWLPGDAGHPGAVPAPPAGRVTVTGTLQASENPGDPGVVSGGLPAGQLGMISTASLVNMVPYRLYDGWVTLSATTAPLKPVPPTSAQGVNSTLDVRAFQNLGYTGEWFVFAAFVVYMWFKLVRRELEAQRDLALGLVPGDDAEPAGEAQPAR
nr:SURF1 family protein [Streptomyces sp. SID5468]